MTVTIGILTLFRGVRGHDPLDGWICAEQFFRECAPPPLRAQRKAGRCAVSKPRRTSDGLSPPLEHTGRPRAAGQIPVLRSGQVAAVKGRSTERETRGARTWEASCFCVRGASRTIDSQAEEESAQSIR